jgi:hypothetical protein
MAVRPVAYDPTGGVAVWHDEGGHGGAVAFAAVRFGQKDDGTPNPEALELTCPVCGALSVHPTGGGAAPGAVQKLFVRTLVRRAALPALAIPPAQRTLPALLLRLRAVVDRLDGPGHFRLAGMQSEDDAPDG